MFEASSGAPTFCSSAKVVTIRPNMAELHIPSEIPARRRQGVLRFMPLFSQLHPSP
jgi:hypothetical protein